MPRPPTAPGIFFAISAEPQPPPKLCLYGVAGAPTDRAAPAAHAGRSSLVWPCAQWLHKRHLAKSAIGVHTGLSRGTRRARLRRLRRERLKAFAGPQAWAGRSSDKGLAMCCPFCSFLAAICSHHLRVDKGILMSAATLANVRSPRSRALRNPCSMNSGE